MFHRLLPFTFVLLLLAPAPASAAGTWRWPVRGEVITTYRNGDDPYAAGQHRGIDIAAGVGDPVVAAVGGEVRYAGALGSSGTVVSVRTADGGYDTSYLHLSSVAVARGQRVGAGDRLGAVGVSGQRSAAVAHLHFGVREAGQRQAYVDPLSLLGPVGGGADAPQAVPAPQAAPAPVAAPLKVASGRAPARVPRAARGPRRAWRPFRAPAVAPAEAVRRAGARGQARHGHVPSPAVSREPELARVGGREQMGATAAGQVVGARGRAHAHAAARAERRPSTGPATSLGSAAKPAAVSAPVSRHPATASASGGGGPDLALVLAGLSLFAAAVGLGVRGRGEAGSRRRGAYRVNRARSRPAHQP